MTPALLMRVKNLTVRLSGLPILNNVTWEIRTGEQWAIIGPNGSGKTTLVKTIAGLLPSSSGSVFFYAKGSHSSSPGHHRPHVCFVSAESHRRIFKRTELDDELVYFSGNKESELAIRNYITESLSTDQVSAWNFKPRINDLVYRFGVAHLLDKGMSSLTTGEISKILILKAVIACPDILLLDEPFTGLDQSAIQAISKVIGELIRSGTHVVLVTHRASEILPETSHVLVLDSSGIKQAGPVPVVLPNLFTGSVQDFAGGKPLSSGISAGVDLGAPCSATQPGAKGNPVLVKMVNVNLHYGSRCVLRNFNWTIAAGENWFVYGPHGSGKTSLLKLITGDNLQAYSNDIRLFGQKKGSGESVWEIKKRLGWVSADLHAKYPRSTKGLEVVCSGLLDSIGLYRKASDAQRDQAAKVLADMGCTQFAAKRYGDLSHGQRQMLLLARSLVKSPSLLLLDEPCEGLDLANRTKMLKIIDHIGNHTSTVVVYVSNQDECLLTCITHCLSLHENCAIVNAP